jgi:ribonuclease Z
MDVWSDIEGHPAAGQVHGVDHLEDVELRRGLLIRPFTVNHSRSSLGYSLIERRHKLKAEFAGKPGPQLAALKRDGVQIEDHVDVVLLTCTGDTALGRFLDLDFVRQSRSLLVECTFYEADHVSRARDGRHLHVDDLPKVLAAVPEARIMLTHVSHRTDLRLAKRIVQRVLKPTDLERVSFLMERPLRAMPPAVPAEPRPK